MEILLKLLTTCFAVSASVRSQTCPYTIGYNGVMTSEPVGPLESAHVYINNDNPVQCRGTVYAWHLCPTLESDHINEESAESEDEPYEVDLVLTMYRSRPNGNLKIVKGSYHEISEEVSVDECINIYLERSEWFEVNEGDMVAACWYDGNEIELAVHQDGKNLIEFEHSQIQSCSENLITFLDYDYTDTIYSQTLFLTAYININECDLDMDVCHENATCSDVIGSEDSYNCTCNTGYTGDGFSCIDVLANERDTESDMGDDDEDTLRRGTDGSDRDEDEEGTLHSGSKGGVSGANTTHGISSREGKSAVIGAAVAAVIMFLLIVAVVGTVGGLVMLYLQRKKMEKTIVGHGTDRGSTKKHGDTLIVENRDTVNEYDYITVRDPDLSKQNHPYELVPFDYIQPVINANEKLPAQTDYCVPMQGNIHINVHDPGKSHQPNTANNQYDNKPSLKGVDSSVDNGYSVVNGQGYTSLIRQTIQEHIYEALSPYNAPASKEDCLYAQIGSYNIRTIPRECIEFISHLGTGQFGSVSKAVWRHGSEQRDVAVKTLTHSANTVKFLQEAAIMAQFKHPNILALHGVVSAGDPKIMVVELMEKGDLKAVVINMRPNQENKVAEFVPLQLLNFSKQVALGLHYLSCRGYVHRDLATRNILVSNDYLCKIADFGLSRDLADDDIYVSRGGKIPLKWCAPEAIFRRKYSTASDVWSYGCVLYEIWSLGHKPFENRQTKQVPQLVKKGYRLPPPPGCPKKIYELMIRSWHPNASSRPQPSDLLQALLKSVDELLEVPTEDVPADSQAAVLGAPLNEASQLYTHLQNTYSNT